VSNSSKVVIIAAAFLLSAASGFGGEVLDNAKLVKMMKEGVALDVIMKLIETGTTPTEKNANCRFDASPESLTEIQKSGKEGAWKPEDIGALQKKVIDVANRDQKYLKELVDRALNVFENADPNEYDQMMRTLAREGRRVVPYLLNKLEEESERKRGGVVEALGRIGEKSENVVRAMSLMLTDRSKPVRLQAAKCIVALSSQNTAKELIDRLNNRAESQDGIAMALGYMGDEAAIQPLTKVLKFNGDSDARVCAAFALGELRAKNPNAVEALLEAVLDERDEKLRETASQALAAKLGDKRAPSYIMKAFHRYRAGRDSLVRNLSYIKDIGSLEFLVEQVDNDDPKVKKAVMETLVILTGEQGSDTEEWRGILEVLRTRPDWVRGNNDLPKVPDARRDKDRGAQKAGDPNQTIPTSITR
jgi:HEAT repeat protein